MYKNDIYKGVINLTVFENDFKDIIDFIKENETSKKKLELTVYGNTNYKYLTTTRDSKVLYDDISIKRNYISISKARPGIKREIKWIVIHDTGNTSKTANAVNHEKYLFNNQNKSVSWHYTVDMDNIINHIPDDEVGYHAGDGLKGVNETSYLGGGNLNGIGIEMAINEGNDIILSYHKVAKLTAQLLDIYNLDISRVKLHKNFSNKLCPKTMINNNLTNYFYDLVKAEINYLKFNKIYDVKKENNKYIITNKINNEIYEMQ